MRLSGSSTRSRSSIEKIESFNQNYTEKEKDPTTFLCCWRLYVAGRGRSVRCFTGPTMDRNLWRMYTIMNLIIVFHNWNWIPLRIILKIIVFNFNILCGTQHWNVKIYFFDITNSGTVQGLAGLLYFYPDNSINFTF